MERDIDRDRDRLADRQTQKKRKKEENIPKTDNNRQDPMQPNLAGDCGAGHETVISAEADTAV